MYNDNPMETWFKEAFLRIDKDLDAMSGMSMELYYADVAGMLSGFINSLAQVSNVKKEFAELMNKIEMTATTCKIDDVSLDKPEDLVKIKCWGPKVGAHMVHINPKLVAFIVELPEKRDPIYPKSIKAGIRLKILQSTWLPSPWGYTYDSADEVREKLFPKLEV